jgi:hypothetical protein
VVEYAALFFETERSFRHLSTDIIGINSNASNAAALLLALLRMFGLVIDGKSRRRGGGRGCYTEINFSSFFWLCFEGCFELGGVGHTRVEEACASIRVER